jgi:hypothetical protein
MLGSFGLTTLTSVCILTLLPSLAPLHLMLTDTPWPHGSDATLANLGESGSIVRGLRTVCCLAALTS